MTIVLQPRTTVSIIPANTVVANADQKILFIGQKIGGTATAGALVENILENTEDALFGAKSMIAGMIRAARKLNKVNRFDAISLDDNGSGVAATGSFNVSGTATEAGTIFVTVGSAKNHKYSIAVANGDTATVIGDAIEAAITADTKVPVSASNTTGTVTITASNDGTNGNWIALGIEGSVAGVTTTVTGMSSGATDPVLTSVFDVVGNNRYQAVVWPYASDVSELTSFLDARFNVDARVLDGVGFTQKPDTLANHLSALGALNSETICFGVDKLESETNYAGPAVTELPAVKSAMFAAIRALRLTDGVSVSQFVITANGPRDAFGGPALASKPYFNTPFPDLVPIKTGRGWTDTEIEQLHDAGGWVIGNNSAGNEVISGEVVTTYKNDSAGNPDVSFKYLNYVDTLSGIREYFYNNIRKQYAQSRLTTGNLEPGRDMANSLSIATFIEGLYLDLSGDDYVLVQSGEAAFKYFKNNLTVAIDMSIGRVTITMLVPIVVQGREFVVSMQLSFNTEG